MKRFTKTVENFICEHCGESVIGSGFTNHCPSCLWSKHVDVHPGDRASDCGGLMEPIALEQKAGVHRLIHRCVRCGHALPNKLAPNDDYDAALALSEE
ncbi:hypothetical protein COU17_00410 [Candidatus Kaiserbacteria bacterium CG10_big_fil_rev_8_21_14_0_10_49_17]|uniref:RNHCP domain-containing protein n=1 Tax=Candidatus Kaiserbacteria bacterium CG10_big_fil_rev_8_21_14_0_10_49_17 TaxID=1974609 RepID=A0A2M6WF54_9BACT|nr:MAG: hypothetical protein COU17_00410 [Candidatus Kaiserbacteria bacterium CG10_big_fil_rev_8_21_14_0_10_49_17]